MMDKKINITGKELRDILAEYAIDTNDVMDEQPQKVRLAKMAVQMLPEADRIIFLLVLDRGSSREVGKLLKCSHSLILKQMQRIKAQILTNITTIIQEQNESLED